MLGRRSIAAKLILVLSVPLALQILIITSLGALEIQAEQQAQRTNRALRLATSLKDMEESYSQFVVSHNTEETLKFFVKSPSDYLSSKQAAYRSMEEVEQIGATDERNRALLKDLRLQANRAFSLFERILADYRQTGDVGAWNRRPEWHELRVTGRQIIEEMHQLGSDERTIIDQGALLQAQYRETVRKILMLGGIASTLSVVGLGVYLMRDIAARLETLKENAVRLARNIPLQAPLKGDDEIAVVDKTFHKMAKALNESIMKERAVIENAQDVICTLDREYVFLTANPAVENMLGWPAPLVLGKHVSDFVLTEQISRALSFFDDVRNTKNPQPLEVQIRHRAGMKIDTLWTAVWSQAEQSLYCVVHNITARRQAERLREEAISMLNHDLRSPIMSLQIGLESLQQGNYGQLAEDGLRIIERGNASCSRLLRMTKDLLDLDRMSAGVLKLDLRRCDMAQIAMVAEEETAAASRAKGISVDSDQAGIFVLADGQRLEQVLVNLLSNAIRFSPEGGKIRISASQRDGFAEVCVEDEGTGIPVDQLNTIFDRYKQVGDNREVREGSGLGLTICKALVELHGGRIWAEIGDQKGSRFKFTVPLAT